ncbi:hypothetical protein CEXT_748461 [Caerostris extrusa]|uniref:Vomeronasal type-1 receptor n=1 Tax=Caerostris extrusa TaxID=172846 RepID=A0AAV4N8V6_CAEEX|nr:hypothetical protein CEXT_748461 [Caerostris extrusa]
MVMLGDAYPYIAVGFLKTGSHRTVQVLRCSNIKQEYRTWNLFFCLSLFLLSLSLHTVMYKFWMSVYYWNIDGRKRSNNGNPASPFLLQNCSTNARAATVLVSAHSSTVPSITICWLKKIKQNGNAGRCLTLTLQSEF